jgi:drug/metabolite transporter (DMT)-like permease
MMTTDAIKQTMGLQEWLLLGMLSLLWGGSFFFSSVALAELPPFTIVWGRVALAALTLNLVVLLSGRRMPQDWKIWARFVVMGMLNNAIPFSLIVYGQTQIASGLAAILNATTPLWTVLLAHWFTRDERLTPRRFSGVLLGLVGVITVIGPDLLGGLGSSALAQIAVVGAAVTYACAGIFGKGFRGMPPLITATGQVTASSLLLMPFMLIVDQPWDRPLPGPTALAAVLGLALLSTALAYTIYFRLLARAGATNLLLVTFLIPVSALLLGALFLGERVHTADLFGMAIIGLGLTVIDGRLVRWTGSRWRMPAAQR